VSEIDNNDNRNLLPSLRLSPTPAILRIPELLGPQRHDHHDGMRNGLNLRTGQAYHWSDDKRVFRLPQGTHVVLEVGVGC